MDVNYVIVPIGIDDHAKTELDTPEIMYPEPLLNQILDPHDLTFMRIDEDIIN